MNIVTETQAVPIYIREDDYRRLRRIVASLPSSSAARVLAEELARAVVLAPELLPSGVVVMNSRVTFLDESNGEQESYILSWPERSDGGVDRVSILAPVGVALLGYREGDEVRWPTPGGVRRLRILRVDQVAGDRAEQRSESVAERWLHPSA